MTINKDKLVSAIRTAVSASNTTANKWKTAGQAVRDWYEGGYDAWIGEKKALMFELVLPALPEETQIALLRDMPRKGSPAAQFYGTTKTPEEIELMTIAEVKIEQAKCLELLEQHLLDKKRANAYQDAMFRSLTDYAFEAERAEAKAAKKAAKAKPETEESDEIASGKLATNKAKLMADCSNWVKRLQKSEGEDFDINATIEALNNVIAVLTK